MKTDNTSKLLIIMTALFLMSLMISCTEEPLIEEPSIENDKMDSIIETEAIDGDDNCPNGGFLLKAGNDSNDNGILEESEISNLNFLCHGENGQLASNLLTETEELAAGSDCTEGGLIVYFGLDLNTDSKLSEDEIQSSFFLCHGGNGSQGLKGNDGLISLSKITPELAGYNCTNGGLLLQSGIDENSNNELDKEEIQMSEYVCNGASAEPDFYEYYFSNGLDDYTGTSDVSIVRLNNEGVNEEELIVGSEINPANGFMYATNSLIHFSEVESISEDLIDGNFEVVEAILYLHVETPVIDGGEENALGVQALVPNTSLFIESEANWNGPSAEREWFDPGTAAIGSSAYDYSDVVLLPDPTRFEFRGTVPMLLDRRQIKGWIESKDNNNGLVMTLVDQSSEYELSIASSENDEFSYRPMLYIKVKKTESEARTTNVSNNEYRQNWFLQSMLEKMDAYNNIF